MTILYKQNEVYFEVSGAGKPVVLLHGFLENSTMWNELVEEFSDKYQLITIDLFGHGKTEKVGYIHSMEQMAEAVNLVLQELTIEKAAFLGHSMGGYVALAFAENFPEKIEKLLLLNSTAEADNEERKKNRDRAKRLIKQNKEAFVSMAIKNLFAEETKETFPEEIKKMVAEAKEIPTENIIASIEGLKNRKDRTEILQHFSGKKILLAGKHDPVVPFESVSTLAKKTDSELITFPNGHMSWLENKEVFFQALKGIL
ncbi:alpha/beta fold hydrolase [Mesonia aquimarina]|uniref:alpha/beta fold hydrolase n=1 Tax=Mesonia aquimarina TaxID=1504967 RepID=UPI000EF57A7A|nr:alpha/beta hydrolase [Mesonia aquimarina]